MEHSAEQSGLSHFRRVAGTRAGVGGGVLHMKGVGMLVVSLTGVNISDFDLTKGVLGKTPSCVAIM